MSGAGYEREWGVDRGFESASVRLLGGRKRMGRYRALPGVTVTGCHTSTVDDRGAIRWRRRESNRLGNYLEH